MKNGDKNLERQSSGIDQEKIKVRPSLTMFVSQVQRQNKK